MSELGGFAQFFWDILGALVLLFAIAGLLFGLLLPDWDLFRLAALAACGVGAALFWGDWSIYPSRPHMAAGASGFGPGWRCNEVPGSESICFRDLPPRPPVTPKR